MQRPVIVLEFNELCPNLMDRFIREGHLPGFKALREQSAVYVTDAEEEPPNLEPWIQWITVHTGLAFSQHRVFDLGDAHKLAEPRIWDRVAAAGGRVWICGSMNATIQEPSARTHFLPDPWSADVKPLPSGEYDLFCDLAWKYVQEHGRSSAPWRKSDYVSFLMFMLHHGLSVRTLLSAAVQIVRDIRIKELRTRRAIVLDRLQWDLFRHTWKKTRPDFSSFFLNSTAHFQHYHWRDMEPERFTNKLIAVDRHARDTILAGYRAMDRIVSECMALAPESAIVLMTALSQQPLLRYEGVGGKCIFKPIEPAALMRFAGVTGSYKYAPVMAEEFHLYFDSERDATLAEQALCALSIGGKPLMRVRRSANEIFSGCDVISAPDPSELVHSGVGNCSAPFSELLYQADGVKSGGHHPDGIFWIRVPNARPKVVAEKLPLTEASRMLADLAGVEFDRQARRATVVAAVAS
jgi:hypothetical protein